MKIYDFKKVEILSFRKNDPYTQQGLIIFLKIMLLNSINESCAKRLNIFEKIPTNFNSFKILLLKIIQNLD